MSVTTVIRTDDRSLLQTVRKTVDTVHGCRVTGVAHNRQVLEQVSRTDVAVVMCHIASAGDIEPVRDLVSQLKSRAQSVAILIVSEFDDSKHAIEFLRGGVVDYLPRPLDLRRLAFLVDSLTLRARYEYVIQTGWTSDPDLSVLPDGDHGAAEGMAEFSGAAMHRLMGQIHQAAASDVTVLMTGETGTGKTHLARYLHNQSSRRQGPFVHLDCATIPETLFESELFGHAKGSFTGADGDRKGRCQLAQGGTLFLDEVDALSPSAQAKLLRLVDERVFERVGATRPEEMDARIIVASNRDLSEEVTGGAFRQDLYFRLSVVEFRIPPLRERRDEILQLAEEFVCGGAERHGTPLVSIAPNVRELLCQYNWPGNVRELKNVIERAVALGSGPQIRFNDLPPALQSFAVPPEMSEAAAAHDSVWATAREERFHTSTIENGKLSQLAAARVRGEIARIRRALDETNNNRTRAARELGVSREAFYKKLRKYGLMNYGQ